MISRIIAAQKPVSGKVSTAYYTYNGDGQRVRRKVATFEIWQVYGFDGELVAEYPQTGPSMAVAQPQKEYGYRNGQLLVTTEPFINLAWNQPATFAAWTILPAFLSMFLAHRRLITDYPVGDYLSPRAPEEILMWRNWSLILVASCILISMPRWQSLVGLAAVILFFLLYGGG